MLDAIAVFLGGGLGSVARYLLTLVPWKTVGQAEFPLATFVTNVAGSFLIGLVVGAVAAEFLPPRAALFAKTGVCGGFTTFSTFALESTGLIDKGEYLVAGANMVLSFALGVAACIAGQLVAGRLLARG